jgi:hypothetical protein
VDKVTVTVQHDHRTVGRLWTVTVTWPEYLFLRNSLSADN